MPLATRLNSVTYAGLKVGEGTSYEIHDHVEIDREYPTLRLSLIVVTRAADEAALLALAAPLEAAWRKPDQDLSYVINSETVLNLSHSGNTGMNSRATCQELKQFRSNRSRCYLLQVTLLLPADLAGRNYRLDSDYETTTDDSGIRTVSIRATYTAVPATRSASAQVAQDFSTYCDTIKTALGGTWDDTDSVAVVTDDQDKIATATTAYREVVFRQSLEAVNDLDLVLPVYGIRTLRSSEPQLTGSNAFGPVEVIVSFRSNVPVSRTQDLTGLAKDKIRPYLLQLAQNHSQASGQIIEAGWRPVIDPTNNTLAGEISFLVQETNLIRVSMSIGQGHFIGDSYVPVLDGTRFARDRFRGPGDKNRQIVILILELDQGATPDLLDQDPARLSTGITAIDQAISATKSKGFEVLGAPQVNVSRFERRLKDSTTVLNLRETAIVLSFTRADVVGVGGGGTGGGGGVGSTST